MCSGKSQSAAACHRLPGIPNVLSLMLLEPPMYSHLLWCWMLTFFLKFSWHLRMFPRWTKIADIKINQDPILALPSLNTWTINSLVLVCLNYPEYTIYHSFSFLKIVSKYFNKFYTNLLNPNYLQEDSRIAVNVETTEPSSLSYFSLHLWLRLTGRHYQEMTLKHIFPLCSLL